MPFTPILNLPYPALADDPDVPRDIRALALALDTAQLGWSIGDVKFSFLTADHPGWVFMDGNSRVRADYPPAFAALMDALLGAHPDPLRIRIPNARRRSPIGADPGGASLGGTVPNVCATGGEEKHTLTTAELASHSHPANDPGHRNEIRSQSVDDGIPFMHAGDNPGGAGRSHVRPDGADPGSFTGLAFTGVTVGAAGSGQPHNNVHPYIAGNWFIATSGAGSGAGGGGGLGAPVDVPLVTAALAAGAGQSGVVDIGAGYRILRLTSDNLARIRLYSTPAKRDADVARPLVTEPPDYPTAGAAPNHGVMLEEHLVTANLEGGSYIQDFAPNVIGSSGETPRLNNIAYRVDNTDVVARTISILFTVQHLELA